MAFSAVLAMCGALFFLAPHHRRSDPFRPSTLAGIYWDVFKEIPELLANHKLVFLLLAVAGAAVCFYPAVLVLMVRFLTTGPQRSGGGIYLLAGLVGLAGAVANFIAMVALDMNISFGVGSSTKDQTAFIALIPMFQIAFALASIAIGVSTACANWAHRMVVAV